MHGTCIEEGEELACECDDGYTAQGLSCVADCADRPIKSCFEGEGTPGGSDLVASLVASRTSGVAPLAVFFDATGTTSTATTRPFHDLGYCWSFGDAEAGCFATTGLSRNQARGPLAGHVFESPGTFVVTVVVRDKENREATKSVEVTVSDPDEVYSGTNTVCISSEGDFEDCPDGASEVQQVELAQVQGLLDTNRRLLFRRGETFTGGLSLVRPGPGTIGAFGEGNPPVFVTQNNAISIHHPSGEELGPDWRVMDIDVDGGGSGNSRTASVAFWPEDPTDFLLLRVRSRNTARGVYFDGEGITIQDCEIREINGGSGANLIYGQAEGLSILGNIIWDSTQAEHAMRIPYTQKAVISSNTMGMVDDPRLVIKLHGPNFTNNQEYTELVVISDNTIAGNGGNSWLVDMGPQNEEIDQRVRNVLFEGNYVAAEAPVSISVLALGDEISIRNNIFTRPSGGGWIAVDARQRGNHPVPSNIRIINNTAYVASGSVDLAFIAPDVVGVEMSNNLLLSPSPGSLLEGSSPVEGIFESNVITGLSELSVSDPEEWADFYPREDGAAAGAADPEYAPFWDLDGGARPSEPSAGALEPAP